MKTKKIRNFRSYSKGTIAMATALIVTLSLVLVPVFAQAGAVDTTSAVSIQIHKYGSLTPGVTPGDGTEITNVPDSFGKPLAGAEFTATQLDETKIDSSTRVTEITADLAAFSLGGGTQGSATTDAAGVASITGLNQGLYLLQETATPAGYTTAAPSIVSLPMESVDQTQWLYNVHVYPKNVANKKIEKTLDGAQDKVYTVGDTVKWTVNSSISNEAGDKGVGELINAIPVYGDFEIFDTISQALTYEEQANELKWTGGVLDQTALVKDIDYTVTPDAAAADGSVTVRWKLTTAGIDKAITNKATGLKLSVQTKVNEHINDADSKGLENIAGKSYRAAGEADPETEVTDPVKGTTAKIVITKVDKDNNATLLKDAEFRIAASANDAITGTFLKDGLGADIIVTTDVSGKATFEGLAYTGTAKSFWLVETKAPTGYAKLKNAIVVDFAKDLVGADVTIPIEIKNNKYDDPSFTLPLTGGVGTALFVIGGIVLMGGAFIIFKKSKKEEQE